MSAHMDAAPATPAAVLQRVLGDLTGLPPVPADAPCRAADADPTQWDDPSAGVLFRATGDTDRWRRAKAKKMCSGCPILNKCLDWALDVGDLHSVLGGTVPEQRHAMLIERGLLPISPAH